MNVNVAFTNESQRMCNLTDSDFLKQEKKKFLSLDFLSLIRNRKCMKNLGKANPDFEKLGQ